MKIILIIITTIFFTVNLAHAQEDVPFDKKNFKTDKKGFKNAYKSLQEGDKLLDESKGRPKYDQAIPFYKTAYTFNPKSAYVNFQLGKCYMNTLYKFKALDYFLEAERLNPGKFEGINYYIARAYHFKGLWDEALQAYQAYLAKGNNDPNAVQRVNKYITECKHGKRLMSTPTRVWIDNMGDAINTIYPEYGLIMTADGSEIYFTSRRPSTTGGGMDEMNNVYFEDIYTSRKDPKTNSWLKAENPDSKINTKGHDAAVALSPDGSRMIVYIDDKGNGNLYESRRKGDQWSKPKILNKEISGPYHEPSAWYSPDGKLLYFVSERPLSKNAASKDKDIYVATWNEKKEKWLDVERLPDNVNTAYDEDGIFMHPDGKTLYFSSKGHTSMGGYDIFKTIKQDDGTWSTPENLGYPINTPDDDVLFVVPASARYAYMTSFREGGFGDKDLYKVNMLGREEEPYMAGEEIVLEASTVPIRSKVIEPKLEIPTSQVAILKGIIRDDKTKKPLHAQIELIDNKDNTIVATFESNEKTGKFLVSLPAGINYGIAVSKEDYMFHSENFDATQEGDYKEIEKVIDLKKVAIGEEIVLRNIFFDLNKYTLRDESKNELDRLTQLLLDNPLIKIEIGGHTDSRGSASYNQKLSENRAKSVVGYLIDKGIAKERLSFKGYGKEEPLITDSEISKLRGKRAIEEAHQENRRTAFKIVANE